MAVDATGYSGQHWEICMKRNLLFVIGLALAPIADRIKGAKLK